MKKNREVKGTSVPTPLCVFFVVLLGFFAVFFIVKLPEKIEQYNTKEALLKNGEEVIADFDNVYKNGQTNRWHYIVVYSYIDDVGNKYFMPIKAGQDTNIESLEDTTVKILIDGEGHCIKADTTDSEILTDFLLYLLVCVFFLGFWIPFIVILIKNLRCFAFKQKLKRKKQIHKMSIFK